MKLSRGCWLFKSTASLVANPGAPSLSCDPSTCHSSSICLWESVKRHKMQNGHVWFQRRQFIAKFAVKWQNRMGPALTNPSRIPQRYNFVKNTHQHPAPTKISSRQFWHFTVYQQPLTPVFFRWFLGKIPGVDQFSSLWDRGRLHSFNFIPKRFTHDNVLSGDAMFRGAELLPQAHDLWGKADTKVRLVRRVRNAVVACTVRVVLCHIRYIFRHHSVRIAFDRQPSSRVQCAVHFFIDWTVAGCTTWTTTL